MKVNAKREKEKGGTPDAPVSQFLKTVCFSVPVSILLPSDEEPSTPSPKSSFVGFSLHCGLR
jgi:hypothetical protein